MSKSKHSKIYLTVLFMTGIIGYVHMDDAAQKEMDKFLEDATNAAASITIINAPLIVIGQGPFPRIINDCSQIITITNTNTNTGNSEPGLKFGRLPDLLNVLIGKAGILQQLPMVFGPMKAILEQLDSVINTNILQKKVESEIEKRAEYTGLLKRAIQAYNPNL